MFHTSFAGAVLWARTAAVTCPRGVNGFDIGFLMTQIIWWGVATTTIVVGSAVIMGTLCGEDVATCRLKD